MRILVAHSFYRMPGGEDRYVREQVDLLRARHVVHLEERINTDLPDGPAAAAVMAIAPGERSALRQAVRVHRPDAIHLHNPYPSFGPAVHLAADRARIPLVHTVHNYRIRCPNGLLFTEGTSCSRCTAGRYDNAIHRRCFATKGQAAAYSAALWLHRFVLRLEDKVDLFVAPSQFVRRRLVEWGIDADRVMVVRNFTVPPPDVPPIGVAGLFLGRLAPERGLSGLLDALRMAGDPPFDIVGTGPDAQRLAARAVELGLHNTRFHGYIPAVAVARFIAAARYVVVPSLWEQVFGLAALEAMAAGRPVVASHVGGLSELVGRGRGRLVAPGDADALAGAVLAYADSEEAAARDGAMARRFVLEECSPEVHLAGLERAYNAAMAIREGRLARSVLPVRPQRAIAPSSTASSTDSNRLAGAPGRRRGPVHVLMAHCYYRDLGGENLSFEAETNLLRSAGVRVTTYTRDNGELDGASPAQQVRAGLRTTWADDTYRDLAALVRRERPDVVHFQNTFPLISPAAHHAVHRLGRPVVQALRNYRLLCANGVLYRDGRVCTDCVGRVVPDPAVRHACYHGSVPQTSAVVMMQVAHRALGTWRDAVDLYVAPSEFARQAFAAAGLPADRIVVKPNFVDPDPGMLPEPGPFALFVGRLAPEKGVLTLLEAWREPDLPPLRIVGDGPLRRELEARVVTKGLEERVQLLGSQPPEQVLALMREARCVVFPSEWYETFGRVAAEAFACGVPVVASRLGAMAEIVEDRITGRLFSPGDPSDLAHAVRSLAEDKAATESMRRAARQTYERSFTAERNLGLLLEIYDRARGHEPVTGASSKRSPDGE